MTLGTSLENSANQLTHEPTLWLTVTLRVVIARRVLVRGDFTRCPAGGVPLVNHARVLRVFDHQTLAAQRILK